MHDCYLVWMACSKSSTILFLFWVLFPASTHTQRIHQSISRTTAERRAGMAFLINNATLTLLDGETWLCILPNGAARDELRFAASR